MAFVSQIELKGIDEVIVYEHWSLDMQEKPNQLERNNIQKLISKGSSNQVIGTSQVFHSKLNKYGNALRNKAKFVAKGYNQQEEYILMKPMLLQLDQRS